MSSEITTSTMAMSGMESMDMMMSTTSTKSFSSDDMSVSMTMESASNTESSSSGNQAGKLQFDYGLPLFKSTNDMDWARTVPCKNITIYGFCKYENKGCAFRHDHKQAKETGSSEDLPKSNQGTVNSNGLSSEYSSTSQNKPIQTSENSNSNVGSVTKFNLSSSSFKPASQSKFQKLSANLNEIPAFVPSSNLTSASVDSFQDDHDLTNNTPLTPERKLNKLPMASATYNFDSPGFQPSASPLTQNPYLQGSSIMGSQQSLSQTLSQQPSLSQSQQLPSSSSAQQLPPSLSQQQQQQQQPPPQLPPPMGMASGVQLSQMPPPSPTHINAPPIPQQENYMAQEMVNPYSTIPQGQPSQEMFFTEPSVSYPLQYHLYAPNPLSLHRRGAGNYLASNEEDSHTLFLANELRELLLKRNEATLQTIQHSNLPEYVSVYHSLVPLDKTLKKTTKSYGVSNSLYKVFSNRNGNPYVLRRLEGYQLINEKALSVINKWKSISSYNASIIGIEEAFTSLSFGDNSLYFVHDYYPLSKTLKEAHQFKIKSAPESIIWHYIVQISNILSTVHTKNMAVRLLNLDKLILTGTKNRIMLSGCGIVDVINFDNDVQESKELGFNSRIEYYSYLQKIDLKKFGELILELMCYNNGIALIETSYEDSTFVNNLNYYSEELKEALKYLLGFTSDVPTIQKFNSYIGPHILYSFNQIANISDQFEATLSSEIENDRLVRLLTKINFILDRPEFDGDLSWSETGERYQIKLFFDYVFHQVNQEGKPVVDLVHVLSCLNKLDVGVEEKILLVSKDETTCMIVTYKDIKNCIESSFRLLIKR